MPAKASPCVAAIDIGTSKVIVLIADWVSDNKMRIVGMGGAYSNGIVKGEILDVDAACKAVEEALNTAMGKGRTYIESVAVSLSGQHVFSVNASGTVTINEEHIEQADLEQVIESAASIPVAESQVLLHVLPQFFVVDGKKKTKDPVGMVGMRLESHVHVVAAEKTAVHSVEQCVARNGLEVNHLVQGALASGLAVLTEDEKELGVCLLDIGGGTTDITVFAEGVMCYSACLPVGGNHVTNDIAQVLGTSTQYAESVKIQHGMAMVELAPEDSTFEVHNAGREAAERFVMQDLARIIESRYEEIFQMVYQNLEEHGLADCLPAGLVVTGGASKLPGVAELAEALYRLPVRHGMPRRIIGVEDIITDPIYSTGVGLLMYAKLQQETEQDIETAARPRHAWLDHVKQWLAEHF